MKTSPEPPKVSRPIHPLHIGIILVIIIVGIILFLFVLPGGMGTPRVGTGFTSQPMTPIPTTTGIFITPRVTYETRQTTVYATPTSAFTPSQKSSDSPITSDYQYTEQCYAAVVAKNYANAIVYCDKALAIDPSDEYALNNKGDALYGLGRFQEALSYYDKALNVNSLSAYAWLHRANALYSLNRYQESISAYETAFKLDPSLKNQYQSYYDYAKSVA